MGIAAIITEPGNALWMGSTLHSRMRCKPFDFSLGTTCTKPTTAPTTSTTDSLSPSTPLSITTRCAPARTCDGYYVRLQKTTLLVRQSMSSRCVLLTAVRHPNLCSSKCQRRFDSHSCRQRPLERPTLSPSGYRARLSFNFDTLFTRLMDSMCDKEHSVRSCLTRSSPSLDPKKLALDELFSVAELSLQFQLIQLKLWAIGALDTVLNGPNSPLRNAPNQTFIRALRVAHAYNRMDLSTSIQRKWITRLHWRELSPLPALLLAEQLELRNLLSHAYFIHLVSLPKVAQHCQAEGALISEQPSKPFPLTSPLTMQQRTHLLAGFYSLTAYWKWLRTNPPSITRSPQCKRHQQCLAAWRTRWIVACEKVNPDPSDADIFQKLKVVEEALKEDRLVQACLTPDCWTEALHAISRKRTEASNHLHHHFDLS